MRILIRIITLFILILFSNFVSAKKWYVDDGSNIGDVYTIGSSSGDDITGDGTSSKPYAKLSKAISSASSSDTIYVDKGSYTDVQVVISKALTIIGSGTGNTIYDGGNSPKLFARITSNNVNIKNLTITKYFNATGGQGQVIDISGAYSGISIENVLITACLGATSTLANINIAGGASVTVKNSFFKCSGYNGAMGGGILVNNSSLSVLNTVFYQNESATEFGGAIQIKGASSNVSVTNSTFSGCVSLKGGAIYQSAGILSVIGSCFINNFSETDDNSSGGGAIFVSGTSNTTISNCNFNTNAATAQAKGSSNITVGNASSADGGAICFKSVSGTASITNCRFENNGKLLQSDGQTLVNVLDDGQDIYYSGAGLNITISNNTFSSANSGEVNIYEDASGNQTMSNNGIYTQTGATGATISTLLTTRTGVSDGTDTGWSDKNISGTTTINMIGSLLTPIRTDVHSTCSTVLFAGWTDNLITQGGVCNPAIGQPGYLKFLSATSSTISPPLDFTVSTAGKYLTFRASTSGVTNTAANTVTVSISIDNGLTWTTLGSRTPTTSTLTQVTPFDLSAFSGNQVKIRFQSLSATGAIGVGIDDIVISNASTIITPTLDFSNKAVQVLYTQAIVGGSGAPYNVVQPYISEDNGSTWTALTSTSSAGTFTLDLAFYHNPTTRLKFETPYANGTKGASLDNLVFNYASSSNTNPVTYCQNPESITSCDVSLNCATETMKPIILKCVDNKSINNCSYILPDYTSELSAYDDCSFTIVQSPAAGSVLTSGNTTVTFTVTDAHLNSTSCSMVVSLSSSISLSATPTQIVCSDGTGSISLTASGGIGSLIYSWTGPSSYTSTSEDITSLSAGTYTVVVTDANGCTATASATINAAPAAITLTATPTQIVCHGGKGSVALSTTGAAPVVYGGDATTNLSQGTYNYTVTDANGCTATASATINAAPAAIKITPIITNVKCWGESTGSVEVQVENGKSPYEYIWTGPGLILNNKLDKQINLFASTNPISVKVKDANGCESSLTNNIIITEPNDPLILGLVKTDVLCFGDSNGKINTTIIGGTPPYSYEWLGVNSSVKNDLNQQGLKSGTYTIKVKDNLGCQYSQTILITEPKKISLTASVTQQPSCSKNTGEISVLINQPNINYQIMLLNPEPKAVISSNKITNLPPNEMYEIYVVSSNGCFSDTVKLVIDPGKEIPGKWLIEQINPTCTLTKGSFIIKQPKSLGNTYFLNNNSQSTTDTVFSGLEGINKITVLSKDNCQRDTTITIGSKPLVTDRIDLSMRSAVCKNTPISELNKLPFPAGYTIKWYDKDPSLNSTAKILNSSLKLTQPSQTLYYTYTETGKCQSIPIQLQVKTSALELVEKKIENTKCGLTTGSIEILATNGIGKYTYQWSTSIQPNFSNDSLIKNLGEGEYQIKVSDKSGCELIKKYSIECEISLIPQIITPKSGNKNQTWVINYYHKYPKVQVSIFNRWGSLVYKSGVPYEDNWDGKPNVDNSLGEGTLPSGTYYFLIDKGTGEKPETGFLELVD